ncbi:mucin-2-like [Teleopsis dalmanni]|uniref:mucin-2-like n=1 Tax=Teleopsis dalmanni TaxID=139649 RepID=UPI0018CE139E|nr:mucin-2-like [Teleopsis dalmanni]
MTKLCLKMFYCIFIFLCINVHLYAVTGAPTHHLTISVEGDTPTLVVTSAEIGITPEVLQQTAKTTITAKGLPLTPIAKTSQTITTTPTIAKPVSNTQLSSKNVEEYRKEFKNTAPKPKSKSMKSQYTKKRQQFPTKDKTIWREKNFIRATEIEVSTTTATTTTPDTTLATLRGTIVTTPLNKTSTEGAVEVAQAATEPVPNLSEKKIGSRENQYETTEYATVETTKIPMPGVVATKSMQVYEISEPTTMSDATTLGNMPRVIATKSLPPDVLATTALKLENETKHNTTIGQTTQSTSNAISTDSVINISAMMLTTQQDDAKAMPKAIAEYATEKIAKETDSATTAAQTTTIRSRVDTATTAKIATILPGATLMDAVVQTAGVSEEILKMPVITTEPDIMTTTIEYTAATATIATTAPTATRAKVEVGIVAQFNDSQIDEIVTTKDSADSTNNLKNNSNASRVTAKQSNLEAVNMKTAPVIMTTKHPEAINVLPTKQQREQTPQHEHHQEAGSIKLIDLEKHDLEAIHALQQQKLYHPLNDGHDGVKSTKKKQLIDKHYLVDVTDMPTTESGFIATVRRSNESQVIAATPTATATKTIVAATTATSKNTTQASTSTEATLIDLPTTTTTVALTVETTAAAEPATKKSISNDLTATNGATAAATEAVKATKSPTTTTVKQLSVNLQLDKLDQTTFPATSPPSLTTTFTPVHSGYLGPIFMGEKTFSVLHTASQRPHEQHESSIASRLRDGRIVEIIAPTALVEQTTEQHDNLNELSTTTTTTTTTTGKPSLTEELTPVLSTTVFEVPKAINSATRFPERKNLLSAESIAGNAGIPAALDNTVRTESKISDIQIEVYDSTIDSIVASTNFKDNEGYYSLPVESAVGTTRPPLAASTQERFTQYVVDRVDSSTPESNNIAASGGLGKPEPAAIEIHINVSEGIGNESEDLEFLYRQTDYNANTRSNSYNHYAAKNRNPISVKSYAANNAGGVQNGTSANGGSDEVLVVEIIDTGENSTDNSASVENLNPIFTFRADADADVELKDVKYYNQNALVKPPQMSDELFTADVKQSGSDGYLQPPPPPPPPPRKPNIDRDSDTIFYISNTEVKVGESLPTPNTSYEQLQQQLRKRRLEAQFFPANYKAPTTPTNVGKMRNPPLRYEEDIYLSPLQHTSDALKIFRSGIDGAPPLDVTYVGESVMEVEQQQPSSNSVGATTIVSAQAPDVIIQPAILPEMSIGVPVIGELPPQIELKEIDFMPDEANQHRSGVYENDIEENVNGNEVDRLVESSIQYGGDLIDEGAGGIGFDGVEGSYPFGNPATLHRNAKHTAADYAHFILNHGVNNLRKDELSVDVGNSAEMQVGENTTLKEYLAKNGNDTAMNISYAIAERMGNATAFSVMEEPNLGGGLELDFQNVYTLLIGLFIIIIPIAITLTMACALQ